MKRAIAAILSFVLLFACMQTALAVEVQVSTDPQTLSSAGKVAITIRVDNTSLNDMQGIAITGYGLSGMNAVQDHVAAGGAITLTLPNIVVGEEMFGRSLSYTLYWSENGEAKTKEIQVPIVGEVAAQLEASHKLSKPSGAKGEKIVITYTLKNPSAVEFKNIQLQDPIAGDKPIKTGLTLAAGASQDITYEYTLGQEDAKSEPVITYQANDETKTLKLEPLTVSVVNIGIDTTVTIGENTQEGILFTLLLKNVGNQNIEKIQVKDEQGNKVNEDPFTLEKGSEKTLSYTIVTDTLRNVSFTITGVDALGQPFESSTRSYEAWPYVDKSLISVSMSVTVLEQLSQDTGKMKVRFLVQNNSSVDISNAVISEEKLGTLETIDVLALGETPVEADLVGISPRELVFTLQVEDPSGAAHTYIARTMADYIQAAPQEPAQQPEMTPAPEDVPEEEKKAGISGTLMTVLIVLAALMAIAGIALLVLSVYEKKNNAKMEDLEDDDPYDLPVQKPYPQQPPQTEEDAFAAPVRPQPRPVERPEAAVPEISREPVRRPAPVYRPQTPAQPYVQPAQQQHGPGSSASG